VAEPLLLETLLPLLAVVELRIDSRRDPKLEMEAEEASVEKEPREDFLLRITREICRLRGEGASSSSL
jgi:hypothetical protein